MTSTGGNGVVQYSTHAELVESRSLPEPSRADGLDAIIVPASRPAANLQTAVDLAGDSGAPLIVLCSLRTQADEVRALLAENKLDTAVVVEVSRRRDRWPLDAFETSRWVQRNPGKSACGSRRSDLSVKRNTGLLLARMLGWERIFFLDDDIRDVTAKTMLSTVAMLGTSGHGYRTAAMSVEDYPDNSVVCHARREVDEFQDVFVSGSVLAVNCSAPVDFFPDLYNEDWLFFYRDAAAERMATPGSLATQLAYDPFAEPSRAAHQEFGDVIAEGLYALLHSGLGVEAADEKYWARFLRQRRTVLDGVAKRLGSLPPGPRTAAINRSIRVARRMHWRINPAMCAGYVAAWQRDQERWERLLEKLRPASSVTDALRRLGLR